MFNIYILILNMKKIFYWSPHLSNVATIKNVINSAKSIKIFNKSDQDISIIDTIGEWENQKKTLNAFKINLIKLSNYNLSKYLPVTGYFKSRIFFMYILLAKFFPLRKILKKEKPEYLIMHLVTSLPLIILLFSKTSTKFILRISGLPRLGFFRKILWKIVSNRLFLITCPSDRTKSDMIKLNIFPKDKLEVLYDPILEVNSISKNLKQNIFSSFKNKKYFLNIGRLTKQKNQILLINAFSEIFKKHSHLNLLIVGDGEEKNNLLKKIKLNKIEKNVHLLGQIDNVYPLIKNSLATISTSLWEDPGAVMIESSYCKKLSIVSDCPNGPAEFLSFGKAGYLFKNNNVDDLINKIYSFLNDDEQIKNKKILLSKKNSKNYTIFNHYKKINQLLHLS